MARGLEPRFPEIRAQRDEKVFYYAPPIMCTYEVDTIIRAIYIYTHTYITETTRLLYIYIFRVVSVMEHVRFGHLILILQVSIILLHHHLAKYNQLYPKKSSSDRRQISVPVSRRELIFPQCVRSKAAAG